MHLHLGLIFLQDSCGCSGSQLRQLRLELRRQVVLFHVVLRQGRQGCAKLLLDLAAILEGHVLHDVRLKCRSNLLRHRVLPNLLRNLGVLPKGHVHRDVRLMILIHEGFKRLTRHGVHVFRHGVTRLGVICKGHDLVSILHAERFNHLPMEIGEIVKLRSGLRELEHRLVLHNLLRHRGGIGIGHGNNINVIVIRLLGLTISHFWFVRILFGSIVSNDSCKQFEFLLHRVVHASLHGGHDFEDTLQYRKRGAHRGLCRHIADLEIGYGSKAASFLDHLVHEHGKGLARFFVRQRQDVVPHCARGYVYVSPLAGGDRGVISLDTETA